LKPLTEIHLRQANKYLVAANSAKLLGANNPAVSAAVHAVILAKDAYCIEKTGSSAKSTNHRMAITELEIAGGVPKPQVEQFRSLLASKNSVEYQPDEISDAAANKLISQARRFCRFVEIAAGFNAN
jgi:hypothetical protein